MWRERFALVCKLPARYCFNRPPICPICGGITKQDDVCNTCRLRQPEYSALRSWGVFNGSLQKAVHRLKYYRDIALGEVLARNMVTCLLEQHWLLDLVVPVPLGVARLAERGYNQAALLAKPIALACHLRYSTKTLHRIRETRSQVGLSLEERRVNVKNSFAAEPFLSEGKNVLVIDDVATSGATVNACAAALRSAGAAQVFAVAVPKLVNIVFTPGKWGKIALNMCRSAILLNTIAHFRFEVGEIVRHCKALPNLERSHLF